MSFVHTQHSSPTDYSLTSHLSLSPQVKCITDPSELKCRRCIKYDSECRFEGHRRGRRKGKMWVSQGSVYSLKAYSSSQSHPRSKQHQVNRRFELIARTLEELRTLTKTLQDAPAIALVASLRYQLLSSTCINEECRDILDHSAVMGANDMQSIAKGQKRPRDREDDEESSSDEIDSNAEPSFAANPRGAAIHAADSAFSIMGPAAESKHLTVTPRPAPGAYSRTSGLEQHNGSHARPAAYFPSRSRMLNRARRSNAEEDQRASKSASLLVEIEDYESVAVVPQAVQTLSNPLKLLAHASDAVDLASRKSESRSPSTTRRPTLSSTSRGGHASPSSQHRHVEPHARAPMEEDDLVPEHRRLNKSMDQREAAAWSHFVDGRKGDRRPSQREQDEAEDRRTHIDWSTYFSRGAFHPRYDSGASIDPIEKGYLTAEQAKVLLAL